MNLRIGACAVLLGLLLTTPARAEEDLGEAHDFTLRSVEGGRVRLSEALESGPVLLDFWATWCGPCKIALPRWAKLVEQYADHGLQLLAVSQDDPRSQPKILPYLRSQGFTFPALLDGDKQVGRRYRVKRLPTTFLISTDGTIVAHHVGFREGDEREIEVALREMLGLPAEAME